MNQILKHLSILGKKVRDRVTKSEGVVVSVSFDLFGCVQAIVNPGLDKDGKQKDSHWFDVSRLEVLKDKPVMQAPYYLEGAIAEGLKGPAEKPPNARF